MGEHVANRRVELKEDCPFNFDDDAVRADDLLSPASKRIHRCQKQVSSAKRHRKEHIAHSTGLDVEPRNLSEVLHGNGAGRAIVTAGPPATQVAPLDPTLGPASPVAAQVPPVAADLPLQALQASIAQLQQTVKTNGAQLENVVQIFARQSTAMKATVMQLHNAVQTVAKQQAALHTTAIQLDARATRNSNLMSQKIHNQEARTVNRAQEGVVEAGTWRPIVREDGTPRAEWETAPDFPASSVALMALTGPRLEALLTFYGENTQGMKVKAMKSRLLEICTGRIDDTPS